MKNKYFYSLLLAGFFSFVSATGLCAGELIEPPPTDTIMLNKFDSIPGNHYLTSYTYSNGSGYFFGTNYLDLDQDPSTPEQNGSPAFAQGFTCDTAGYEILEILFLVGNKQKHSDFGTPIITSVHLLDDSSTYTVNTSSGSVEYTIAKPGTILGSTSVPWDDINVTNMTSYDFTVARLPAPIEVDMNYAVVVDLVDFYLNGDEIGFMASNNGGASGIFGKDKCLWLYPDPTLWLQVSHIYSNVDKAIGIFPVIDDGTTGIQKDRFVNGLKLGYTYPNPASEKLTVLYSLKEPAQLSLRLVDNAGQIVHRKEVKASTTGEHKLRINTSAFPSGTYYLILSDKKNALSRKVLIRH